MKANKKLARAFDRALAKAEEKKPPRPEPGLPRAFKDPRMPPAGTILESKPVKGKCIKVEVCDGFVTPRSRRPDGKHFIRSEYRSLSAVMAEARGLNSNGFFWFGLGELRNGEVINARKEPTPPPKPAVSFDDLKTKRLTCAGCGLRRISVEHNGRNLCRPCYDKEAVR